MEDDKIFFERMRDAYVVSRGKSPKNSQRVLIFFQRRAMWYDEERREFRGAYEGRMAEQSTGRRDEPWHITGGFVRAEEGLPLLRYAAYRTAERLAEKLGLRFENLNNEDCLVGSLDECAEGVVEFCLKTMKNEKLIGATPDDPQSRTDAGETGDGRDVPF